jgi:RHS repeat-associated protein
LNDPLNITGYSQVLKQTETNLETGEQANITYIIGRNRIAQIAVKNGTEQEFYFTFDGHGSTRILTDIAGAIVELYAFDAYGNAIGFAPSVALTEFLYSGEQFDSKIGQQYLRARYYDPATGRFNRLDPFFGDLNDPLSLHKYIYAHADPVNGIDPNGEAAILVPILVGLLTGLLAFGGAKLAGYNNSEAFWIGAGVGLSVGLGGVGLFGGFSKLVGSRLMYGALGIFGVTAFFTGINLNAFFFNKTQAGKDAQEFLNRFDEIYKEVESDNKEIARKTLQMFLGISGTTRPDTNYVYNVGMSAVALYYGWITNDPNIDGLHQVCGDWTVMVAESFKEVMKDIDPQAKEKCKSFGLEFHKAVWKSVAGNNHITLCLQLTLPDGTVEKWQVDDGWEFHTVGSPFIMPQPTHLYGDNEEIW